MLRKKKDSLLKKTRLRSAEAAAVSILVHVLLILLAGSVVAVRYIQKRGAELNVVMTEPKLERRQMQMPQTLERVRQTSRRPKIVSTRVAADSTEFSVPDLGDVGELSTQKFDSPFARSGRDFRVLSKGIGVSAPDFRFLGVRGEGEAVVFIIDASARMFSEETGGVKACEYIKRELAEVLSELPSSVLFNVLLCDGQTVAGFRSRMVPVSEQNRLELTNWITPFFTGDFRQGLPAEQNTYLPEAVYQSAIGDEAHDWARALQAALEQRPDTVYVVSRDWGRHTISQEKWERVVSSVLWFVLGIPDGLSDEETEIRDDLVYRTSQTVAEEVELRIANHDPVAFLRDLRYYSQYSKDHLFDHMDAVCRAVYDPVQQAIPLVHCVRLVSEAEEGVRSNPSTQNLKDLASCYDGDFAFLDGEHAARRMRGVAEPAEEGADEQIAAEIPESVIRFFGTGVRGRRIGFVLDASPETYAPDLEGTNSFEFLKGQLLGGVAALNPETLFNVFVCDGPILARFQSKMGSASNSNELAEWLEDIQIGLDPEQGITNASVVYATAIDSDIQGVPFALQAAMEQRADTILVSGAGMGHLPVNREKVSRIVDFSIIEKLNGRTECDNCGYVTESEDPRIRMLAEFLESDKKQRDQLLSAAADRMKEDIPGQGDTRAPLNFFNDVLDYIEYLPLHIREHLMYVAKSVYPEENEVIQVPKIYFAIFSPGGRISRKERMHWRQFHTLFPGTEIPVEGAASEDEIRQLNSMMQLYPSEP